MPDSSPTPEWRIATDLAIGLDRPRLIGIVNGTPDSFSDGGLFASVDSMIGYALRRIHEGADVIDVGGESTRPGAARVPSHVQIERTVPFISALRACSDVPISIDTTRAEVAEAAIDAGATIVNDVSAGVEDPALLDLAAQRGCGLILMHRRAAPPDDRYSHEYERAPVYDDLVADVASFLGERGRAAEEAGVDPSAIVVDPGLGFGKSVEQNFELITRTAALEALGYPLLSAASRKSFIGVASGVEEPRQRVIGSTVVSVVHALAGVRLFRVHDVAAHREALAVAMAVATSPSAATAETG